MRNKSVTISIVLHAAVFAATMISLPWLKRDFEIPPPISVELVEISKVTQTPKPVLKPTPKEDEKKEEPKEDTKPPPAPKNTASEAVTPVKKEPVKEEKKPEKKKDTVLVDKNAAPEKKKAPKEEKKKEVTEKKPERDFSSVLKNLEQQQDDKPQPKKDDLDLNLDELFSAKTGANTPIGARMTMSEEEALRRQLEKCWNVPFGAKDAENLQVEVFMVINTDRTLRAARIVDQARYNKDSFFRAAADSAMRAVRNPLCSPFELPPDKYDIWNTTIVTFDPSMMF
ncbi:MAG: energy transducer TonB [Alphaproteobacteria bacterium]|nr:energy transducer TonB [Alphaproteobacteria bacterium]